MSAAIGNWCKIQLRVIWIETNACFLCDYFSVKRFVGGRDEKLRCWQSDPNRCHQCENNFETKESQFFRDWTNHCIRLLTFKSPRRRVSVKAQTLLSCQVSKDKVDKPIGHITAINFTPAVKYQGYSWARLISELFLECHVSFQLPIVTLVAIESSFLVKQ